MDDIELVGEAVDKLITVDMVLRGRVSILYDAARAKVKRPLSLFAAEKIMNIVKPDDSVFILTGLPATRLGDFSIPETDGPPGAATLARALCLGFGVQPIIICEEQYVPCVQAASRGAGLNPLASDAWKTKRPPFGAVTVESFPVDTGEAKRISQNLLKKYEPVCLISIERPGRNEKNVYHASRGADVSAGIAKVDLLFEAAKASGVPTIGIGDGGNELGLGFIEDEVKARIPYGARCQCPCGGGVAAHDSADTVVIATVSNWGAWGIEACLSTLDENPDILHDSEIELRTLQRCVDGGAADGEAPFTTDLNEDGVPVRYCIDILNLLHRIVVRAIKLKRDRKS